MNRTSTFIVGLIIGLSLTAGVTYAWSSVWNGTAWIANGGVIDARKIAENFEYLKAQVAQGGVWLLSGTNAYYNNGYVGIGTMSPTQKLDVTGNVKGTGLCIGSDCRTSWPGGGVSESTYATAVATCSASNCSGDRDIITRTGGNTTIYCPSGYYRSGCGGYSSNGSPAAIYPNGTGCYFSQATCACSSSYPSTSVRAYIYCVK